jgi:hypothetical protein
VLELAPLLVGAVVIVLTAAGWVLRVRRRPTRPAGPFPDVPDAPAIAGPVPAPGLSGPYSSLDPSAPPKPGVEVPERRD